MQAEEKSGIWEKLITGRISEPGGGGGVGDRKRGSINSIWVLELTGETKYCLISKPWPFPSTICLPYQLLISRAAKSCWITRNGSLTLTSTLEIPVMSEILPDIHKTTDLHLLYQFNRYSSCVKQWSKAWHPRVTCDQSKISSFINKWAQQFDFHYNWSILQYHIRKYCF